MRTGNAFWAVTFRERGRHECRFTLLDAGADAVAEIAIPEAPWEESAGVPAEAMSRFRTAVEQLPETWPAPERAGDGLTIETTFEVAGTKSTWSAALAAPGDLPEDARRFLAALVRIGGEALLAARSRKALDALAAWCAET